jgi:hypothetical protein
VNQLEACGHFQILAAHGGDFEKLPRNFRGRERKRSERGRLVGNRGKIKRVVPRKEGFSGHVFIRIFVFVLLRYKTGP